MSFGFCTFLFLILMKFSSTFEQLLYYLYTDQTPPVRFTSCLGIIELANRLVLPRLLTLVEKAVIEEMSLASVGGGGEELEVLEEALRLVQPCQIHNAQQLSRWCLTLLAHNYNKVCRMFPKILRALLPGRGILLASHFTQGHLFHCY